MMYQTERASIGETRPVRGPLALGAVATGALALTLLWWTGQGGLLWELFSDRERIQRVVETAGL